MRAIQCAFCSLFDSNSHIKYLCRYLWPGDLDHSPDHPTYNYGDPETPGGSVEDSIIFIGSGVFHRPSSYKSLRMTFDRIGQSDGQQYTLMLTENLQGWKWSSRYTGDIAFGIDVDLARLTQPPHDTNENALGPVNLSAIGQRCRINATATAGMDGRFPRPSSPHAGSVNVLFCDGRATSLSDSMDFAVYIALITSNGGDYGEPELDNSAF